ncbi:UDP-N-acetylmuramoyl-L-alanine--D-glutamate ligase [Candidatus Saccharibacteria bacterium]|nr:UDP-N-acetylmuramoyl-L-alanine--D-glutamate ligase [Candidatus Saccharibacteria bacterium]
MNIALAGFGKEGKASYDYWNRDGNQITIVDEQAVGDAPEGVATIIGSDAFSKLADFDLIIRSPGINPKKLPYENKVWSATNEFFKRCPAETIGVTGTKGKGTTCSLIASILRAAGNTVHLVGNIGEPALGILPEIKSDDIVVYELSSFQLWDIQFSPDVAVVLGIEPDHLDVHDSFEDYVQAKANIRRYQEIWDECYYHPTNENSRKIATTSASYVEDERQLEARSQNIYRYGSEESVFVQDGWFVDNMDRQIASVDSLRLPGKHNVENACAAIAAAQHYTIDADAFKKGLEDFTGLPHRLKFVEEVNRVKYYDDSIATTPGSAIAAIASFEEPKILILGGKDKGADYTELIESCSRSASTVIAIGSNGPRIAQMCEDLGVSYIEEQGGMTDIVERAADIAQPGSVVILCPAASSFDMFKSYADRGDQFIGAVKQL